MKLQFLLVLVFGFFSSLSADDSIQGTVNGLFYEVKGAGKPVIFIHGGQMDRRMWDFQWDALPAGYRLVRYDIRGFGKSDPPLKPYSDRGDLKELLENLGIEKAVFVGLSLGAAIAVDFSLENRSSVEGLVLVCPGLAGFEFKDRANDLRAVVEAARDESYDKAAELWLSNPYMSVAMEKPALQEKLRTIARENGACWLKNPLLNRSLRPPAAARLGEIRAPTLVIGGARDVSDIHRIVDKLASEIPNSKKVVIAGAGHIVPMEEPHQFNQLLKSFLESGHGIAR